MNGYGRKKLDAKLSRCHPACTALPDANDVLNCLQCETLTIRLCGNRLDVGLRHSDCKSRLVDTFLGSFVRYLRQVLHAALKNIEWMHYQKLNISKLGLHGTLSYCVSVDPDNSADHIDIQKLAFVEMDSDLTNQGGNLMFRRIRRFTAHAVCESADNFSIAKKVSIAAYAFRQSFRRN